MHFTELHNWRIPIADTHEMHKKTLFARTIGL